MPPSNASRPATADLMAIATLGIALLSVSFAPIFIRLSEMELGANATVFNRFFVFFVAFGIGKSLHRQGNPLTEPEPGADSPPARSPWLLLASAGVVSTVSLVLWAVSLQYTTVAKCMLLNNLTPLFTSLGGWLWFGKRFDVRFLAGMAIAIGGAIALSVEDLQGSSGLLLGDIYALLSAVFLGAYFLIVEQLRTRLSATTILLWRCAVGSGVLLPIVLLTEGQLFPHTVSAIVAVIGLGLVSEGLGQRLLADSMDKFSSSFIALFLLLEPVISAILAWLIFEEKISPITWLGFVIVLTGIYLAQSSQTAMQIGSNATVESAAIAIADLELEQQ